MHIPLLQTLRVRLTLLVLLVHGICLGILSANMDTAVDRFAVRLTEARIGDMSRLMLASFGQALEAGETRRAIELLDEFREPQSLDYLVLIDEREVVIGARGWDRDAKLPAPDPAGTFMREHLPPTLNMAIQLNRNGIHYGQLRFGVSTDFIEDLTHQTISNLIWLNVGVSALILSMIIGSVFWFGRGLHQVMDAAEDASVHDLPPLLPAEWRGEPAALVNLINRLIGRIRGERQAVAAAADRLKVIADYTFGVEVWINPDGRLAWISESIARLAGYTVNECMDMRDFPAPLATLDERSHVQDRLREALSMRETQDMEFRANRRDGRSFWATFSLRPVFDAEGQFLGLRASIHDSSRLKEDSLVLKKAVFEAQQAQALAQTYVLRAETERSRLSALLSAMRFGVLFVDLNNNVVFHNPAFNTLWLIDDAQNVSGRPIGQVLQVSLNRPPNYDISAHLDLVGRGNEAAGVERLVMNDGRIIHQQLFPVRDEAGALTGHMWVYEDVTQEHYLNERMMFLAERDALTGLYNRHAFQEQLGRMLVDAERANESLAVLYFDLDEFKYVNDTFGHGAGDSLLKLVAREISSQVRRNEVFARLGGDEFAILVPGCNQQEASYLAGRVVAAVQSIPFAVGQQSLRLSSSLGIALYPFHAESAEELVAHADTAMYQAKAAGKSTWRMYKPEQDTSREAVNRLTWNEKIQQALANEGLVLHFQGIYHAEDCSLAHLEALVRMRDPDNPDAIIPPGQFILHAERSGKIVEIDRWVVATVVRMLAQSADLPSIAVNISGRSFDESTFPDFISDLLHTHGVEPSRLMVELTETAAVSDMRDAQRFIEALRATGCTVCLDDFGAGFSSFAYLKHLKAKVLKIDGLFIRDLPRDVDSQIFVNGMARMARDMGKETVAEFVEDAETLRMLVEMGVDMVQGFYLDRPQAAHPALTQPKYHATPKPPAAA
ncbi:EAL domain-containing protein [Burkholderiaceae bacterium DAT-1]|nr:EAL domain-containing protein [Burkholderiaceae bacterium DAT-1]